MITLIHQLHQLFVYMWWNWKNWNVKSILQYKSILQVNINLEPLFINCMKAVRLSFNMVCIKGIFILPTTKSEWFKLTSSVKFFDVSQKWQKKCKKYVSKCHLVLGFHIALGERELQLLISPNYHNTLPKELE